MKNGVGCRYNKKGALNLFFICGLNFLFDSFILYWSNATVSNGLPEYYKFANIGLNPSSSRSPCSCLIIIENVNIILIYSIL